MKRRLDVELVSRQLVVSRSQAESYIKLGYVSLDSKFVTKPGIFVTETSNIKLHIKDQYVSRAGLKLASVVSFLKIDFRKKVVLDVGSSTGGFTDFSLRHGAQKVIAVDVGADQMHSSLLDNPHIELHEKTDIRDIQELSDTVDIIVVDVSFISVRDILPHILRFMTSNTKLLVMVKPQFEANNSNLKHKGVIKNDKIRRQILKDFELWVNKKFVIVNKLDSAVAGSKGNVERFYLLKTSCKITP